MTRPRLALYGGSFNPPGLHHRRVVEELSRRFDEVIVCPCGPRPDKPVTNDTLPVHRAFLVDLCFGRIPRTTVDLSDLEAEDFTRTHALLERCRPRGSASIVVPAELIRGGRSESVIARDWERGVELWDREHFTIVQTPDSRASIQDLPPHCETLDSPEFHTAAELRRRIFERESIADSVTPEVAAYIARHRLYLGGPTVRHTQLRLRSERIQVLSSLPPGEPMCPGDAPAAPPEPPTERDPRNEAWLRRLAPYESHDPEATIVVGGDGTMLRAIRQTWRRRLPLLGVNTGHLGFLLNVLGEERERPSFFDEDLLCFLLPLLRVEMTLSDGTVRESFAFNDAWVERATGQTAWIKLTINGEVRIPKIQGDGILVSTAAGSSSYARAMGASPSPLNLPVLHLVGSNILTPTRWKPVTLPLDSDIVISTLDPRKRPLRGFVDGNQEC
ncbi:MAG TPA: NAD(+)/NADH kinase, partial [Pirellulales bacterium]